MKKFILIIFLLLFCCLPFANAATYYVNKTVSANDTYTSSAGNNLNPGTATLPFATLSKALSLAVSGDSIFVDADVYNSALDVNLIINSTQANIHILGAGLGKTIFDGVSGFNFFNFITISANQVSISDLSIQNYDNGGAVIIRASGTSDSTRVQFNRVHFENNRTYLAFFTSPSGPEGGAIWVGVNGASVPSVVRLYDCQFSNNFAQDGLGGGAIFVSGRSNLIMVGCRTTCNNNQSPNLTTYDGGAIYFQNSSGTLYRSYFSGNEVNDQQGGAVYANNSLATYLPITISRSIFQSNHGRQGTAVFIEGRYNCSIVNSLFFANETTGGFGDGGTISSKGLPNISIVNSTIANNIVLSGTDGSGLANEGANSYSVYNSIIWGNQVGNVSATSPVNASYCLIQPIGDAHTGTLGNLNTNPLFLSTGDFTLQSSSPAINAGNLTNSPLSDLTGFNRNGNPDMGAFEFGSSFPSINAACSYWIPCQVPTITSVAPPSSICSGSSFVTNLSATTSSNQTNFTWLSSAVNGITGHSLNGTGNISETLINTSNSPLTVTYSVTPIFNDTCSGTQVTYAVIVNPIPVLSSLVADTICSNQQLNVNISSNVNSVFTWVAADNSSTSGESLTNQNGSTINDIISNFNTIPQMVSYSVTPVSVSGNCTGPTSTVNIWVNPLPSNPSLSTSSLTACTGDSIAVSSSVALGNIWSTGDTTQLIYVSSPGTLTLVSQNIYSCNSSPVSVQLSFNPQPAAPLLQLANVNPLCLGDSVQLISSLATGNTWNTGDTTQLIYVFSSGLYSAYITDLNGCTSDTSSIQVVFNSNPPVPVLLSSGPINFCAGDSVIITSSAASGNVWSTGETSSSITVTASGTYSVAVTDSNTCTSVSNSISVNVFSNPTVPTVTVAGPSSFCYGDSTVLTSSSSTGNTWSTGDTTQAIVVNASGNYFVSVGAAGCNAYSDSVAITEYSLSQAPLLSASDTGVCFGQTILLNSSQASGNIWSTGQSSSSITVSSSGTYWVYFNDQNSCSSDTAYLSVQVFNLPTPPTVTAVGGTSFCQGDSILVVASQSSGITWLPGGWSNDSIYVTSAGIYTVNYTDSNACSILSQPVQITMNLNPPVPIVVASGPLTFCEGDSVVLTVHPGTGILWSPIVSADSSLIVTQSGQYSVTFTDSNSCTSVSQLLNVVVNTNPAMPLIQLSESDSSVCNGQQIILSASPTLGITWFPSAQNAASIAVSDSGYYWAVYSDANGCSSDSAGVWVAVDPLPLITSVSIDTAFCGLNSGGIHNVQVVNGFPTYTYQWFSNSIFISSDTVLQNVSAGNYNLVVTDANGCSDSLTTVIIPSTPGIQVTAVSDIYQGLEGINPTILSLPLNGNPVSYSWNVNGSVLAGENDSVVQLLNLSQGNYTVEVIAQNAYGCFDTASVLIIVDAEFEVEIPNVFTPNGDQTNDVFTIQVKGVKEFSISVYDRWGLLLWTGYGPKAGWDGKAPNGVLVPEGTYYYIFSGLGLNDKKLEKAGFVLLAN